MSVTLFKYMGQVLTAVDNDFPEVVGNLWKAQKIWACMAKILEQEGASPRVSGIFQGGGTGGPPIRVGDVGDDPLHGQVLW